MSRMLPAAWVTVAILFGVTLSACRPARVQSPPPAARPAASGPEPGVYRAGDPANPPDLIAPIVIRQVVPKYTADAVRANIEGSVDLDVLVRTDGTVGDVRVARSLDTARGLDAEAIKAARLWLFRPGTLDGRRVPVRVRLTLHFQMG